MNKIINKKLLHIGVLFLCLSMILSSFSAVNVRAENDSSDYGEVIELLKIFNIADNTTDVTSFAPGDGVSRAEFALHFYRFLNVDSVESAELYYNDIPRTYYAYTEITALTKLGYMSGVGNKLFDPESPMEEEWVYAMFAKALGAAAAINSFDGDQTQIIKFCRNSGILDNVTVGSQYLSKGNLFKMMYNTLLAYYYDNYASGGGLMQGTNRMMYVTRGDVYEKSGQITAIGKITLDNTSCNDDNIIINGNKFDLPDFDVSEYLGRYVKYIYTEYKRSDDVKGKLIWLKEISNNDVFELDVNRECSYDADSNEITYYENNKAKKVVIPENITLIYNGRYKGTGVKDVFAHDRYTLRLVKSGSSSKYDIAVVWEYTNVFVDNVDKNELTVHDKITGKLYDFKD